MKKVTILPRQKRRPLRVDRARETERCCGEEGHRSAFGGYECVCRIQRGKADRPFRLWQLGSFKCRVLLKEYKKKCTRIIKPYRRQMSPFSYNVLCWSMCAAINYYLFSVGTNSVQAQ